MTKMMRFVPILAAAFIVAGGFASEASAATKKKLTYEEAYAKCKTVLDKEGALGTSTQANERHTRGAACMKKYGHKL